MKLYSIASIVLLTATVLAGCNGATARENASTKTTDKTSAVIVLSDTQTLPESPKKLMVIDFNATWCGPCRLFAPKFHKTAEEFAGKADFYSVDVDIHSKIAQQYGVRVIPTVVMVKPDGTTLTYQGTDELSDFSTLVQSAIKK